MDHNLSFPTNLTCGYFDCSTFTPLKISPKRICTMFEIEYFLEDGGNTYSNGATYPIRENWVRLCLPGEERYSDLPFKTKYVKFNAEGKLAELLYTAPPYFFVYRKHEVLTLLDEIISLASSPNSNEILLYGKLLQCLALILEESEHPQTVDPYKNEIVLHAQNYIQEHFADPICLADMAKQVNLSPNYFHTLFTTTSHQTPRAYLEQYRVAMAKKFLLTTNLSLGEIAELCGFKTQQYLSIVFKAHLSVSPAEFRRYHQNAFLIDQLRESQEQDQL